MDFEIVSFVSPDPKRFSSKENWTDLGGNRFMAVCYRFVVVKRRGDIPLDGPLIDRVTIPVGSERMLSSEEIKTETFSDQIQKTVEETFTTKTSDELSAKLRAKVGAGLIPSAEIATEVLAKMTSEIANAVKDSLTASRSYTFTVSKKNTDAMTLRAENEGSAANQTYSICIRVWEWIWDFYLYDMQHLSFKYAKRNSLNPWSELQRTNLDSASEEPLKSPLFSVKFYEPTGSTSVIAGEYQPQVRNAELRHVSKLTTPFPEEGVPQTIESLETYAKRAFPATPEEKHAAKKFTLPGKPTVKKTAAAPKPAARKAAAPRKSTAKKATLPRKSAVKKTAAPRKPAVKKARR